VQPIKEDHMKKLKLLLVMVCVAFMFLALVYHVVVLPFSSPAFDVASVVVFAVAALILYLIGRKP
jgi:cell division septal protein FtsQ